MVVHQVSSYPSGDLTLRSSDGDIIIESNLIVNNSVNFKDLNVFRTFEDGHTIYFGMRINDQERLELYKFDSRVGKSTVVNSFDEHEHRGEIHDISESGHYLNQGNTDREADA